MVTVQDLINNYKEAKQYEYSSIVTQREDGFIERHSNVYDLKVEGNLIRFKSTVDIRNVFPDHIPKTYDIEMRGQIVEKNKITF